jgi:hypothetical protein
LTKAKMLKRMHPLVKQSSDYTINRLAFSLYDKRKDEKLTVDEVYNMFKELPLGSPVYFECLK